MTAIISDWLDALSDTFKPSSATAKWNVGVAIGKFYKRMIIPLILVVIVDLLLVPWGIGRFYNGSGMPMYAGTLTAIEILGIVIGFLAIAPIGILIEAVVYHVFGQMLGSIKKGTYADTVSATVHSDMPYVSLYFAIVALIWLLLGFAGKAGLLVSLVIIVIILVAWKILVFVDSFSAIHNTTKRKAFMTWLVPTLISAMVFALSVVYIWELYGLIHLAM